MQNRGSTNESPNNLECNGKYIDTIIYWLMEKTSPKTKTLPGNFQITTPKNH